MENKKKYIIWVSVLIIIVVITKFFLVYTEKKSHYDNREETCNGKTITSIEYNIDEKKCFETKISACQNPSFKSIDECKKLNWVK